VRRAAARDVLPMLWGLARSLGEGSVGNEALAMVADQRVDQMSFGFRVGREAFEQRSQGGVVRVIQEIEKLIDVSLVTFPAYSQTCVSVSGSARNVVPVAELHTQPEPVAVSTGWSDEELRMMRHGPPRRRVVAVRSNALYCDSVAPAISPGPVCS